MSRSEDLRELVETRDAFFAQLARALQADERVEAAWLADAHGRGEDDEWSDFDLHVAVSDRFLDAVLADPAGLFGLAGPPLLVQAGFPSDSIPSGRFWLVLYAGPIEVDWNIGPASKAARQRASSLIFEKTAVSFFAEPVALSQGEMLDQVQKTIDFFWAMAPIAVKYAGRGWTSRAVLQIELLRQAYEVLWNAVHGSVRAEDAYHQNRSTEPAFDESVPRPGPTVDPASALLVIESFCAAAAGLQPALDALGSRVSPALPIEVGRLCRLAQPWAARGGTRPQSGSRR